MTRATILLIKAFSWTNIVCRQRIEATRVVIIAYFMISEAVVDLLSLLLLVNFELVLV